MTDTSTTQTGALPRVRVGPHLRDGTETRSIMALVVIALVPAGVCGAAFFGLHALLVVLTTVAACVLTEAAAQRAFRTPVRVGDLSAVVTGMLLAFCLPPGLPLWMAALGGFLSVFLVKELFGGIGYNIFNPALAGRAILLASFPAAMTRFTAPFRPALDAVTTATPLSAVREQAGAALPTMLDLFLGRRGGCIGETCAPALLAGAALLLACRVIAWEIPAAYLLTIAGLAAATGQNPVFHLLSGGLLLGAFFMATDYVTSPLTGRGKLAFGVGCGLITYLIRMKGGYPEGVCYSILFMNMLVPFIDRWTMPRRFGG